MYKNIQFNKFIKIFSLFMLSIVLSACFINSADKKQMAVYDNWRVFKEKNVCYAVSFPVQSIGNYKERNLYYLMVVVNPNDAELNKEILIYGGKEYKDASEAVFVINDNRYSVKTYGNESYTEDEAEADRIIQAMLENNEFKVIQQFEHSEVNDTYSLAGFKKAYQKLHRVCK